MTVPHTLLALSSAHASSGSRRHREDSGPPFKDYHRPVGAPTDPLHTPRRVHASMPGSISTTETLPNHLDPAGRKGFWRKLSSPPSATTSRPMPARSHSYGPASIPHDSDDVSNTGSEHSGVPGSPGLAKKRSSGQLLAEFGRGLSRVGSVMRRPPGKDDGTRSPRATPTRQPSRLGLSKQGSIRRQVQEGSWRGRQVSVEPDTVREEDAESRVRDTEWQDVHREDNLADDGDEGIGRPFNVAVSDKDLRTLIYSTISIYLQTSVICRKHGLRN
jgi:hypothetical protein